MLKRIISIVFGSMIQVGDEPACRILNAHPFASLFYLYAGLSKANTTSSNWSVLVLHAYGSLRSAHVAHRDLYNDFCW